MEEKKGVKDQVVKLGTKREIQERKKKPGQHVKWA
jgi:hypothetical protein